MMSNVVNDFNFQFYNNTQQYKKHDVVYGINASDTKFYYATQDTVGNNPTTLFSYVIGSFSRTDDLVTVNFTQGAKPPLAVGSCVIVTGKDGFDYTGIAIYADGGSISYLNPGWNSGNANVSAGAINTLLHPSWSTGFFWVPSNSTNIDFQTKRDFAQFGDGYTQQGRLGINSIGSNLNMNFENRSNREAKAIINFVQVAGGVQPITINLPITSLLNNPATKYLLTDPKVTTASFDLNHVTVTAMRIYNP